MINEESLQFNVCSKGLGSVSFILFFFGLVLGSEESERSG